MRLATNLLSLCLSLAALAGPAFAQQGFEAQGTATLNGPHGPETGTITVSAWGADHCRITIDLGPPALHRRFTAVANGMHVSVTGPADLAAAVPLPIGAVVGCPLLPGAIALDRLAAGGATLAFDSSSRPSRLAWTAHGQVLSLAFADYSADGGIPFAETLTETADGAVRLVVKLGAAAAKVFSDSDFPIPPRPAAALRKGGQQ